MRAAESAHVPGISDVLGKIERIADWGELRRAHSTPYVDSVWRVDHDYHTPSLYPFRTFSAWLLGWCQSEMSK